MKKRASNPRDRKSLPKREPTAPGKSSQPSIEKSPASSGPSPENTAPAFPIVGIGASAGGLEAFTQLLKHLPVDTGMGFVLVQHLDPEHESALVQLLARATSMPVHEVTNKQRPAAHRSDHGPPVAARPSAAKLVGVFEHAVDSRCGYHDQTDLWAAGRCAGRLQPAEARTTEPCLAHLLDLDVALVPRRGGASGLRMPASSTRASVCAIIAGPMSNVT